MPGMQRCAALCGRRHLSDELADLGTGSLSQIVDDWTGRGDQSGWFMADLYADDPEYTAPADEDTPLPYRTESGGNTSTGQLGTPPKAGRSHKLQPSKAGRWAARALVPALRGDRALEGPHSNSFIEQLAASVATLSAAEREELIELIKLHEADLAGELDFSEGVVVATRWVEPGTRVILIPEAMDDLIVAH